MRSQWRWAVVAVGTAALVLLPWTIARIPHSRSSIGAADLLARVRASADVAYSGLAESEGGLQLPDARQFNSVANLVGARSQLRVWYTDPQLWRVDSITPTGENDVHMDGRLLWEWDYESSIVDATIVDPGQMHLPRPSDLTPPELARRFLAHATPSDVTRLGTRRIAGHDAPGIRLVPREPESTIRAVDVWADPRTGLPLQVQALAKGGINRPIESRFLEVRLARPADSTIRFRPNLRSNVDFHLHEDLLTSLDTRFARAAPATLAGLSLAPRSGAVPAVALYGGGVTSLALVPVPNDLAGSLIRQLSRATGLPIDQSEYLDSITISVGPVNLVVASGQLRAYVLAGTVTLDGMQAALNQLAVQS
jgi:outer membrane lipoprotein-sorting protein